MPYPAGTILFQKYRIEALAGQGACAEVYCATYLPSNLRVALKVLRKGAAGVGSSDFAEYAGRFKLEARLGQTFKHPCIIPVYALEQDEENLALVMQYAEGGNLAQRMEQSGGVLPLAVTLEIAIQVAEGLSVLHDKDVIHRDLKPSNILLDQNGHAMLADFGLAQIPHGPSLRSDLSTPNPHPGTPGYKSPEQQDSGRYLTSASDVYALGLVLFEMLTGKLYAGQRPGTRARDLRKEVPAELDALLARMLSSIPAQRPWNGKETAELLRSQQPKAAEKPTLPPPVAEIPTSTRENVKTKPPVKKNLRRQVVLWMVAAIGLCLVLGVGGAVLADRAKGTPPFTPSAPSTAIGTLPPVVVSATATDTPIPFTLVPSTPTFTASPAPTLTPLPTKTEISVGQIIYLSGRQGAWAINALSAGEVKEIGVSKAQTARLEVAPDGQKVSYLSYKNSQPMLVLANLKTGESTEVLLTSVNTSQLATMVISWGPKSDQLVVDTHIINLAGEMLADLREKITDVSWSPDGTRMAGVLGGNQVLVYWVAEKTQRRFVADSFNWLDNSQILTVTRSSNGNWLTVKKVNIETGNQLQIVHQGVVTGCNCVPWQYKWENKISPSLDKVLIYRYRQPFYDYLWVDLTKSEASYIYSAGKLLAWSGWAVNSAGVFFKSPDYSESSEFPSSVITLANDKKDNGNVLAYSVSPFSPTFAALVCVNSASSSKKVKCDLNMTDLADSNTVKVIDSHTYYVNSGFAWSPDGSMIASVVEQDGLPHIITMKNNGTNQQILVEVAPETTLAWVQ